MKSFGKNTKTLPVIPSLISFTSYSLPPDLDKAALGKLAAFPTELLVFIFEAADLAEAFMLAATNGQLLVIGYASMVSKLLRHPTGTQWSYDRVICLGDWETESLPPNFLTTDEKLEVLQWTLEDQEGEEDHPPEETSISHIIPRCPASVHDLATYEDQTFGLYRYGEKGMDIPSSHWSSRLQLRQVTRILKILYGSELPKEDHRICDLLQREIIWRGKYARDTLVLVNITKYQYVRAVNTKGEHVLDYALSQLTCWGQAREHGEWAGDRLAIVPNNILDEWVQRDNRWRARCMRD